MLTDATPDLIDECVRAFEAARAAGPARVADHLPPADHPDHGPALAELVRVDMEYAWAAGRPVGLDGYLAEFPRLAEPALLAAVAFEEFRQRADRGERPDPAEYRDRYGVDTAGWGGEDDRPPTAVLSTVLPKLTALSAEPAEGMRLFRPLDSRSAPPTAGGPVVVLRPAPASDPVSLRPADASTAFPEVGTAFAGFRLVDELGRGAFARVYLARQDELADRPVALKVSASMTGESRTLAQLQHTNIVPVYSVHRAGGLQAVCMPYFGATTLADVVGGLRREGSLPGSGKHFVSTLANRRSVTRADPPSALAGTPVLPAAAETLSRLAAASYPDAALWLAARLADGLDHAHGRGVVHRDLKPANVLLADDGQPMLLDFNLAEDRAAPESAERVGGTLPYMAPEQIDAFLNRGGGVDARCDIYALGLVLFELLAGGPAFAIPVGPAHAAIPELARQRRLGPPPLRPRNPAVTPAAEAIVHKCLAPDPADRYQTARDLRDDLDRHLANRPLRHAPNPSARERMRKWARRHPRLSSSAAVGGLAAAVLVGVGAAAWGWRETAARHAAADQFRGFVTDARELRTTLGVGTTDPEQMQAGLARTRAALAGYGATDDPHWTERPAVRRLNDSDRDALRTEVGELLFLAARATAVRAGTDPAGRAEAAALSERAAAAFPGEPPPAVRTLAAELTGGPVPEAADDTPRGAHLTAADLLARGRPRDALPFARRAADADPGRFDAWFVLGQCLAAGGADARAEAAFDTCLALDPGSYWAHFNRGLARLRQGNHPGAAADFTVCLDRRPEQTDPRLNRALARRETGDLAGAVADLTAALDGGAAPTRVLFQRARVYRLMGRKAEAAADVAAGLKLTPKDEQSWVARGLARRATDPAGAVRDFDAALLLNPNSRAALQSKASVLSEDLKRDADAVPVLDRVVELYPDYADGLAGRGVLHARLGDAAKAKADAARALRVSREPFILYQVAGIYARLAAADPSARVRALALLGWAFDDGVSPGLTRADPELDAIRNDPEFQALLADAAGRKPAGR